jgi:hypothetical protein
VENKHPRTLWQSTRAMLYRPKRRPSHLPAPDFTARPSEKRSRKARLLVDLEIVARAAIQVMMVWMILDAAAGQMVLALSVCILALHFLLRRSSDRAYTAEGGSPETWQLYH